MPAPSSGSNASSGSCDACHAQDSRAITAAQGVDPRERTTWRAGGHVDEGPRELLMVAGGVSLFAIVVIFLSGLSAFRGQVRAPDEIDRESGKAW